MKVLITGSRGFIGSHLADALEKLGHTIIHYDLKDGNDVLDAQKLKKMAKGVDGIVHFAAVQRVITGFHTPFKTIETNIMGLSNVLEAVQENHGFLIFGSSKTVYGKPERTPVHESDPKNPSNIYSLSKVVSEMIIKDFCKNYNLRAAVVRFSTAFGAEDDLLDRVIPTFMYKAIKGIDIIIEDAERAVDPTFIDDITPVLVRLVEKVKREKDGFFDDYNICSGDSVKIKDMAEMIIAITNSKAKIVKYMPSRTYDYGNFYADPSKIKEQLGFKATDIKTAMKIYYKRFLTALNANKFSQEDIDFMLSYYKRGKTTRS